MFTRDLATALRFSDDFEVGALWINEASRFRLDMYPFGGMKRSGVGREGVRYAIEELSQIKFTGITRLETVRFSHRPAHELEVSRNSERPARADGGGRPALGDQSGRACQADGRSLQRSTEASAKGRRDGSTAASPTALTRARFSISSRRTKQESDAQPSCSFTAAPSSMAIPTGPNRYILTSCSISPATGSSAINTGYRLAGDTKYPGATEDVASVIQWVRDHADEIGVDASRIFLMGHSAGAAHAGSYAYDKRLQPSSAVPGSPDLLSSAGGCAPKRFPKIQTPTRWPPITGRRTPLSSMTSRPSSHVGADSVPTFVAWAEYENPLIDVHCYRTGLSAGRRQATFAACVLAARPQSHLRDRPYQYRRGRPRPRAAGVYRKPALKAPNGRPRVPGK